VVELHARARPARDHPKTVMLYLVQPFSDAGMRGGISGQTSFPRIAAL